MPELQRTAWVRVSKSHPCPVCEKTDYCTRNGNVVHCMRVPSNHPQKNGMGWIHRLDDSLAAQFPAPPQKMERPRPTDDELDKTFARLAMQWYGRGAEKRADLARLLGVAQWTLDELQVGWNGREWTIPERAPSGLVVGIGTRPPVGKKKFIAGGRRGLVFASRLLIWHHPILLVEGPSDVAAGLTMGLNVVGRPSNTGGAVHLGMLLKESVDRIFIIAENDVKTDGSWPGKQGALLLQVALAKKLRRSVLIRLPPASAKDLRSWLNDQHLDVGNERACGFAGVRFLREMEML